MEYIPFLPFQSFGPGGVSTRVDSTLSFHIVKGSSASVLRTCPALVACFVQIAQRSVERGDRVIEILRIGLNSRMR